MTTTDKRDCIIVRCGDCKRISFAAVNEPHVIDADMMKEIGRLVAKGGTVEHVTTDAVRQSKDFGCKCKP